MQNHRHIVFWIFPLVAFLLASCAKTETIVTDTLTPVIPTSTATVTATPDPCSSEHIAGEIRKVHRLMREFDDASALSTSTGRDQLKPTIADLQRIRRDAEDQDYPSCLRLLKEVQLAHMNTFIQTLIAFMSGADQETINQGITLSRQLHDQYMIELARLQGVIVPITFTPVPTVAAVEGNAKTEVPPVPTPSVPIVTNSGQGGINLRLVPTLTGQTVGMLAVGQSALALGQTKNGEWIMVEVPRQPGQTAWVYSKLVEISGPGPLPVINEEP
jgi:hypothetical protein